METLVVAIDFARKMYRNRLMLKSMTIRDPKTTYIGSAFGFTPEQPPIATVAGNIVSHLIAMAFLIIFLVFTGDLTPYALLTPIFCLSSLVPSQYIFILKLNPIFEVLEGVGHALSGCASLFSVEPAYFIAMSFAIFVIGARLCSRTPGIARRAITAF